MTEPYQQFDELLKKMQLMTSSMESLNESILDTLKENTELKVENQLLRDKINQIENHEEPVKAAPKMNALKNLEEIYNSGYHVCNMYYGSHRQEQEDCMFCLDLLFHQRQQKQG
ncbi:MULTISPECIES: initiation control protein YabA [Holzapfeliella]|uniref:Initiation control protein YabA n=1 Tax=Holzapfeliella saturejae TaxID=3082953 RepID=A0ABU8SFJ5_9LACO